MASIVESHLYFSLYYNSIDGWSCCSCEHREARRLKLQQIRVNLLAHALVCQPDTRSRSSSIQACVRSSNTACVTLCGQRGSRDTAGPSAVCIPGFTKSKHAYAPVSQPRRAGSAHVDGPGTVYRPRQHVKRDLFHLVCSQPFAMSCHATLQRAPARPQAVQLQAVKYGGAVGSTHQLAKMSLAMLQIWQLPQSAARCSWLSMHFVPVAGMTLLPIALGTAMMAHISASLVFRSHVRLRLPRVCDASTCTRTNGQRPVSLERPRNCTAGVALATPPQTYQKQASGSVCVRMQSSTRA